MSNDTKLRNVRFWWPRRELSPEAVADLLNRFLSAGAGAEAIPARWFFGGETRTEALTRVAFNLQNAHARLHAADVPVGENELSLAYHVLIWAPGSGELGGDWGLRLQIDRVVNGLGPDDLLDVTFSPPRGASRALVDVGVEALQATRVDGIVFDPDWREKVVPNVPAPEPEIATLYTQ